MMLACRDSVLHGIPVRISVRAPSPVTLQAAPKLFCRAKIASISAVPSLSKPSTPVIRPGEAMTVPPGNPASAAGVGNRNALDVLDDVAACLRRDHGRKMQKAHINSVTFIYAGMASSNIFTENSLLHNKFRAVPAACRRWGRQV